MTRRRWVEHFSRACSALLFIARKHSRFRWFLATCHASRFFECARFGSCGNGGVSHRIQYFCFRMICGVGLNSVFSSSCVGVSTFSTNIFLGPNRTRGVILRSFSIRYSLIAGSSVPLRVPAPEGNSDSTGFSRFTPLLSSRKKARFC